jgi:membrane-bound lytic murein transglycosylase B
MRPLPVLILILALGAGTYAAQQQPASGVAITDAAPLEPPPFDDWLTALLAEARERGYSERVLKETLSGIEPIERVIQNDRSQAELAPGFERYLSSRVTKTVVRRGRALSREHRALLRRVSARYGVQPRFLLAIWGIETRYGRVTGRVPVFQALTTLAWEPRRADFFRRELFDALTIVSSGYIKADQMKGSWAGAMGQTQFMPSSYLKHAVDFDGNGNRDIWASTSDALASIANYLKAFGWKGETTWGREVRVSAASAERIAAAVPMRPTGCYAIRNMTERIPLSRWRALGVTNADGTRLPAADIAAGLVKTDTRQFLVYDNYDAILAYNCAHYYALSVALLADRLR